jgi:hypothetical protein
LTFDDCNSEVTIVGATDSSADNQFVVIICKRKGVSEHFEQGHLLRIVDLIIDGRGEEIKY